MQNDLEAPGVLITALKECSRGREVIVTITDRIHSRWALNLQHNLHSLGLPYALVIADSGPTCDAFRARLPLMRAACCAHSSYMRSEPGLAAGLKAYNVHPNHVYHLWWQRWHYAAAGVAAGYNMLMLDADISLRADPYPLLRTLSHSHALVTIPPLPRTAPCHADCTVHATTQHTAQQGAHPTSHCTAAQVVGLDSEAGGIGAFYNFPAVNVGLVYCSAGGGAAQWVMEEVGRRARHYLRNAPIRRTAAGGVEQMVLWEQDLFRDALEGAAFNSTRYRHSLRHGFVSGAAARRDARAHAQPWEWQTTRLPDLPPPAAAWPQAGRVPWLPLHLPPATHLAADADAADAADAPACTRNSGSGAAAARPPRQPRPPRRTRLRWTRRSTSTAMA